MASTKILIAEDDPTTRCLLVDIIEEMGMTAIGCSNGRRALETLYDNPDVALLITDVMMPEMDGRLLVQIVRGNKQFDTLQIIMISAVAGTRDLENVLSLGHVSFLAKPLSVVQVQAKIKELLHLA
jgi:CheY-like chemotaxis protein